MHKKMIMLLLLIIMANTAYAKNEHIFLVKAFDCNTNPRDRSQTGFRINGTKGVITALHGVAGCGTVKVQSETGIILYDAVKIKLADVKDDVALLSSSELEKANAFGLNIEMDGNLTPLQPLTVTGHPFGISSISTQIILRDPPIRALEDHIPPGPILNALKQRLSPDPQISVLSIQGNILPGHSGAPVVNSNNAVVAVANGGLGGGATGITWAIPISNIHWTDVVSNTQLNELISTLPISSTTPLFSFDINIPPKFPITKNDKKSFTKGEMDTNITITPDGKLDAATHIRGTENFDGFCGNVTFWLFDNKGNRLGIFGMGQDHQWCVGSGIESLLGGGSRTRSVRQTISEGIRDCVYLSTNVS